MRGIVQVSLVYVSLDVAVDRHSSHRVVDVQKCPCVDSNCPEYLCFVDSNFVAIADRSVGVLALMLGRTLDVAERWDNCSTVHWLVVDDLDCRKSDSDQGAARMDSLVDYMSPDCNCYHGYLNRMDLRDYCQGLDSYLHLHVFDKIKYEIERDRERERERERQRE